MKMPHTTGLTNSNKHSAVTEPKWDDTPSSYKSLVIINSTFFMQTKSLQSPSSFNPKIGMLMVHPKIAMVNCHPSPWAPWRPGPTRPHSVTNEVVADQLLRAKVRGRGDVRAPSSVGTGGLREARESTVPRNPGRSVGDGDRMGMGWWGWDGDGMGMGKPPIFHEYSTSFRFFHVFRREDVNNLQDFPRFFLGEIGEHRLKLGVGVKQKMSGGSFTIFYRWLSGV